MTHHGTTRFHELSLPCSQLLNRAVGARPVKWTIQIYEYGPDTHVPRRNRSEGHACRARRDARHDPTLESGRDEHAPPKVELTSRSFRAESRSYTSPLGRPAPSAEEKWGYVSPALAFRSANLSRSRATNTPFSRQCLEWQMRKTSSIDLRGTDKRPNREPPGSASPSIFAAFRREVATGVVVHSPQKVAGHG